MKPDEMAEKLRTARALIKEIYDATDIPQIQSCIRHADQNLHWALWNLGESMPLRPELSE